MYFLIHKSKILIHKYFGGLKKYNFCLFIFNCSLLFNNLSIQYTNTLFNHIFFCLLYTSASHTGKTMLAQKLLEKYKYPYLSIDHLKMGLIRSGYTKLTPQDDDMVTEYLCPIVREIIKTAIENKQNLIVEGCYIPFDWANDFAKEYLASCWSLFMRP